MINILSYVGMNMQSEVCLWCLLGLVRTIFDATLFKVNANLKQVWQMTMPEELTMPVQRVLRTMVSGVMLVQCFTVYVYLASYIVLLYPVFLEERPTLVLPWLLLAAIRKLLCELTSLALGLGTCVLLGPARPPCIKFVVVKFTSIMPAFYMWMLVFSYYHALKVASAFKTFPAVLPPNDNDYGLELAVRRRRTKSLQGEEQLRKKLVAHYYGERTPSMTNETYLRPAMEISSRMVHSTDTSIEEVEPETDVTKPLTMSTTGWSDIGAYEDWFGSEVMIPRDTDRILEQIVLMLLRIGAYLKKEGIESIIDSQILNSAVPASWHQRDNIDCAAMNADDTDTPPLVGSSKGNMASYLREYPQIFMKKQNTDIPQTERTIASLKTVLSHVESEDGNTSKSKMKRATPDSSMETITFEVEKVVSKRKITLLDNKSQDDITDKLMMPRNLKTKQITQTEENKSKSVQKNQRDSESKSNDNVSEILNKVKNNLQGSKVSIEENNKIFSDSIISSEENVKKLTHNKTSNEDNDKTITHRDMWKKAKSKEVTHSAMSNESNTNELATGKISIKDNIHSKISIDDDNRESTQSTIFSNRDSNKITHSKTSNKDSNIAITQRQILKDDKNKVSNGKILTEDKNKHCTQCEVLNEDRNNSFTQSEVLNADEKKVSTDIKISDKDNNKKSADIEILIETKNKLSTDSKISNDDKNQESIDAITSSKTDEQNLEQNSQETRNDKTKETPGTSSNTPKRD